MIETTLHAPPRSTDGGRTPELDEAPLGDLDTARLRNMVAQRVFGERLDPVRIGRYPVLRRVGQGGMGVVYAGYDNELDRRIAIKLLRRGDTRDAGEAERMRARLLREARALAQLPGPRIVQIYEVGEHDGQVFLAMEFVEGETLRQWSESRPRSVSEIVEMYCEAARGLAAAHAAGLVHRDFKPDNAIVVADAHAVARVRVLDFGLAMTTHTPARDDELPTRSAANDDVRLTATGAMLGTPAYMSPEQFEGKPTDARTDQFSFAVALFEALYGARPFPGETMQAVVEATLEGRVVVPGGRRVPSRVLQALRRALSRDPGDRFASIDALVRALDLRGRRWRWAAAVAVAAIAGVGWLGVRAGELSDEVTVASERADDAEARLRAREQAVALGEISLALIEDPTAAIERLASLPDDAHVWRGEAWRTAARAEELAVADRVIPLPAGWESAQMLDDRNALLHRVGGSALWDIETGAVDVLADEPWIETDVSPGGRWAMSVTGDDLRIIDVATRVEQHWWIPGCEPARLSSDEPVLALDCVAGDPHSLAWSAPSAGVEALGVEEAPPLPFASPMRFVWYLRNRTEMEKNTLGASRIGKMTLATHGDTTAGIRLSPAGMLTIEPLLVWRGSEQPATIAFRSTPSVAAFSDDGSRLAVGTVDGAVWWLDVDDLDAAPARIAAFESGQLAQLAFSHDGRGLCGTTGDGRVVVWDVLQPQQRFELRSLSRAGGCHWHADGSFAVFGNGAYRHYPTPSFRRLDSQRRTIVDAGEFIAVLGRGGDIDVIGRGVERRLRVADDDFELALAATGRRAAVSGARHVRVLDVDARTETLAVQTRDHVVAALRFTSSGDAVVWVDANTIHIHRLDDDIELRVATPREGFWRALTTDGELVLAAFGGARDGHDQLLTVDARTGEIVEQVELPTHAGSNLEVLDMRRLAYTDRDGGIVVIDRRGELVRRMRDGAPLLDLRALADGRGLASIDVEDVVEIWDVETGESYEVGARSRGTVVEAGVGRLHYDASLALDDRGSLWILDRTGELSRYELRVPWPGPELAPWIRARVHRTPPSLDALLAAWRE